MTDDRRITITIDDEEIRRRVPAEKFEIIIDTFDHDPRTQKYEAMYHGKRNRENVEKWLNTNGYVA